MIRVVDVTQHYGVRPVLRQVSLEVQTGELGKKAMHGFMEYT